jgi:hypothetical protein
MCLNSLREGRLKAKNKGIQNFPATCAALNSAIKKRLAAAKAAALRINLNVEGHGIVAAPVHAPSRAPLLLPLLLSHNIPLPRVH